MTHSQYHVQYQVCKTLHFFQIFSFTLISQLNGPYIPLNLITLLKFTYTLTSLLSILSKLRHQLHQFLTWICHQCCLQQTTIDPLPVSYNWELVPGTVREMVSSAYIYNRIPYPQSGPTTNWLVCHYETWPVNDNLFSPFLDESFTWKEWPLCFVIWLNRAVVQMSLSTNHQACFCNIDQEQPFTQFNFFFQFNIRCSSYGHYQLNSFSLGLVGAWLESTTCQVMFNLGPLKRKWPTLHTP